MTMKESYSNHHGPCIAPYECWFMESQDFVNCCRMCNFKAFNSRFRAFLSDLGFRDSRRVEVLASLALQGEILCGSAADVLILSVLSQLSDSEGGSAD